MKKTQSTHSGKSKNKVLNRGLQYRYRIVLLLCFVGWCGYFMGSYLYGRSVGDLDWFLLGPVIVSNIAFLIWIFPVSPVDAYGCDFQLLSHDVQEEKTHPLQAFLLINRQYIFPIILTAYLLYLLLQQTSLRGRDTAPWYLRIEYDFLMYFSIISGILVVFVSEKKDALYIKKYQSLLQAYVLLVVAFGMSLIGTYIIHQQLLDLGFLGFVIGRIVGLIIFLMGVMLLDDDEEPETQEI